MRRQELIALHDRIIELKSSDGVVNSIIAEYLGWTSIQYDPFAAAYRGHNPATGERSLVPDYTGSVDAALTTIPDRWCESYHRRFSGDVVVHCHPRGDLNLSPINDVVSTSLPVGFSAVGILAQAMMLDT